MEPEGLLEYSSLVGDGAALSMSSSSQLWTCWLWLSGDVGVNDVPMPWRMVAEEKDFCFNLCDGSIVISEAEGDWLFEFNVDRKALSFLDQLP